VATPTLAWPGRTWIPGRLRDAADAPPVWAVEHCGGADRLIAGDGLLVTDALASDGLGGKVDLVYVDPPYMSQADYVSEARLDGPADGRVTRSLAYEDSWGGSGAGDYLDMLAPRLEALASLLAPTGTLWVHLDWRASYLVRVLLDEIFGRDGFKNEIVWRRAPNLGRQAVSGQFGRTIDTILVYGGPGAKIVPPTRLEPIEKGAIRWDDAGRPFTTAPRGDYTDKSIARLEAEGRVHRTSSGRVYVKYFLIKDAEGQWCRERRVDALWTDVAPLRHAIAQERTGFPTQKPRALLERIIRAATPEGGLVVDVFAGSGTTGVAAHALGRRFVLGDASPVAIATARARLLREGARFTVQRVGAGVPAAGPRPEVRVSRANDGGARVELSSPSEPLAWAVDPSYDEARPFDCAWHSERTPGARPVPAAKEALLERGTGRIGVRVYSDDGSVGTVVHSP
jgi:adenine-specific DNA-methyltransferase